ncbi:hypothetical protein [Streptomyces sp. NPDC046332]|uniref:hypothetical protein n=1 Tax=unclassified Streptomyces TaxID=2593676 RepID=UPI0033FB0008
MPEDTPRGYTYPEYTDTQNFPAAIQELATDIDADVQDLYDDVDHARYAPTAAVSFAGPTPLANGVTTDWAFTSEDYDNAGMVNLGVDPTDVSITEDGVYWITGWAEFAAAGVTTGSVGVFIMTTGALLNLVTVTRAPDNDKRTEVSATCIAFCATGEDITLALRQTTGAPLNIQFAKLTVTKVSP